MRLHLRLFRHTLYDLSLIHICTMNELTYQVREANYLPEKMAIAKSAYECIEEGESVYLDSGTTTCLLYTSALVLQGVQHGGLVHKTGTGFVDKDRRGLHLSELGCAEHVVRFRGKAHVQ